MNKQEMTKVYEELKTEHAMGFGSAGCLGCVSCPDSKLCVDCIDCSGCVNCHHCKVCFKCTGCYRCGFSAMCIDCTGYDNMFLCKGLINRTGLTGDYWLLNKQVTRQEFNEAKGDYYAKKEKNRHGGAMGGPRSTRTIKFL